MLQDLQTGKTKPTGKAIRRLLYNPFVPKSFLGPIVPQMTVAAAEQVSNGVRYDGQERERK